MAFQGERQNSEKPEARGMAGLASFEPGTPAETLLGAGRGSESLLPASLVTVSQPSLGREVGLLKPQDLCAWSEAPGVPVLAHSPPFSHLQDGLVKDLPQRVCLQPGDGAVFYRERNRGMCFSDRKWQNQDLDPGSLTSEWELPTLWPQCLDSPVAKSCETNVTRVLPPGVSPLCHSL